MRALILLPTRIHKNPVHQMGAQAAGVCWCCMQRAIGVDPRAAGVDYYFWIFVSGDGGVGDASPAERRGYLSLAPGVVENYTVSFFVCFIVRLRSVCTACRGVQREGRRSICSGYC
jgi:hypothetical protein